MERRNINLKEEVKHSANAATRVKFDRKEYESPHKPIVSNKNMMKRSKSRRKSDLDDVDESLAEESPAEINQRNFRGDTGFNDMIDTPIEKPFQQHNSNKMFEKVILSTSKTPIADKSQRSYNNVETNGFNRKDIENYNYS